MKWNKIAGYVGGGRTGRDCAQRFRDCRELILKKRANEASMIKASGSDPAPKIAESAEEASDEEIDGEDTENAASVILGGESIELENPNFKNISLIQLTLLR